MQILQNMSRLSKGTVDSASSGLTLEPSERPAPIKKAPDPDLATSVILRYKNTLWG